MIQSSQPISLKFTWSRLRFLGPLKRSRFLLLPNTRKKAFSLLVLPGRANPRVRRSMGRPPRCSKASSSKHSCWECWVLKPLKTFQMSNTSHLLPKPPPPSTSSMVFIWSRAAGCLPDAQVYSFRDGDDIIPPPAPSAAVDPPIEILRRSDGRFLRMRSSAPRSPSRSRELTLK
uniref:Uncharacterized protein n=1 Tax=Sander lucioperca TaxID=283035 RepID=A0A8C9X8W9_SANLU